MSEANWWATTDALIASVEGDGAVMSADQKAMLASIATGLPAEFVAFMGRKILKGTNDPVEELFDGSKNPIYPSVTPLVSITSVKFDSNRAFGNDTVVTDLVVPVIVGDAIYFQSAPGNGAKTVKLTYIGGYATLPADINRMFLVELRTEWKRRKEPHLASISMAGSSVSVSQTFGISEETKRVLFRYRGLPPMFGG